jgi:hypothetical protein
LWHFSGFGEPVRFKTKNSSLSYTGYGIGELVTMDFQEQAMSCSSKRNANSSTISIIWALFSTFNVGVGSFT